MWPEKVPDVHDDCSFYEEGVCRAGEPEHCESVIAYRSRQDILKKGVPWGMLIAHREPSGWRHYLEGEPVHCGVLVMLQGIETRCDDYGDFELPTQSGILVRYEASLGGEQPRYTLHAHFGGYEFVMRGNEYMRFRWPERKEKRAL